MSDIITKPLKLSDKKDSFFNWLDSWAGQPYPPIQFKEKYAGLGINKGTGIKWHKEWEQKRLEDSKLSNIAGLSWEERHKLFDELLYRNAFDSKSTYKDRELYARRWGLLVDKQETKLEIGLTADEITRRNLEAERALRQDGFRVEEVQEKPPLLPDTVCLHPEQEHSTDS